MFSPCLGSSVELALVVKAEGDQALGTKDLALHLSSCSTG